MHLQACKPLLFPTSLTKGDSSTAFRSLLIKSSLLLLGTYYISGLREAQINKPQGPQGLTVVVVAAAVAVAVAGTPCKRTDCETVLYKVEPKPVVPGEVTQRRQDSSG